MGNNWIKNTLLLIVPILFYIGGLYCVDLLIVNRIIPPKIGDSQYNLFLIANCVIIEIFLVLVLIITNTHREKFSDFRDPLIVTIVIGIIGTMPLPDWIKYTYSFIPFVAIAYMMVFLYRYTYIPFINTIWKLKGNNSIWIFNKNKTLNLCSSDGSTTFYSWDFNSQTDTLVISNEKEKRVYIVRDVTGYNLVLFRLSTGELLDFNKFACLEASTSKESTQSKTDKAL